MDYTNSIPFGLGSFTQFINEVIHVTMNLASTLKREWIGRSSNSPLETSLYNYFQHVPCALSYNFEVAIWLVGFLMSPSTSSLYHEQAP